MYNYYTIQSGDTIDSISRETDTSKEILYALNGDYIDTFEGNTIMIPKNNNPYFNYYQVSKGDTLTKIANEMNIDIDLIALLNGLNKDDYIYQNQVLLIPKSGMSLYITREGDTLDEVSKGFNVKIEDLINQNKKIYLQKEQLIVYKYQ